MQGQTYTDAAAKTAIDFVTATVGLLVDEGSHITFTVEKSETGIKFLVGLPQPQLGRVIGREGRMARAIRIILQAASAQNKVRLTFDVVQTPTPEAQ